MSDPHSLSKIAERNAFGGSLRRRRQARGSPPRDVIVSVRLSRDDHTVLWQAAARANMTMGRFIVGAVQVHALRLLTDARFAELQAIRAEVQRLGSNVNQAVKRLHATGYGSDLVEMKARVYATLDRIDAAAS